MERLLNVKPYNQSIKGGCGPSCVMMVLNYFSDKFILSDKLEREIWEDATFKIISATVNVGLAIAALKRGFKTEVLQEFELPKCFQGDLQYPKQLELKKIFLEKQNAALNLGARIRVVETTAKILRDYVNKGIPPIVLFKSKNSKSYHFIVIKGYSNDGFIIIDPELGQEVRLTKPEFEDKISISDGKTAVIIKNG